MGDDSCHHALRALHQHITSCHTASWGAARLLIAPFMSGLGKQKQVPGCWRMSLCPACPALYAGGADAKQHATKQKSADWGAAHALKR